MKEERTMNRLGTLLAMTALAFASPAAASAADVYVSGGGTATFDFMDGGTIFTVEAYIDAAGNVDGHFYCSIPGVVVIVGDDLLEATVKYDKDGNVTSVTLYGLAHGFDAAGGVFEDMPFAVQLWPGGPGVGRFLYDDPFVGPSGRVKLREGDYETVETGYIRIVKG
jgi:hypothetical protein